MRTHNMIPQRVATFTPRQFLALPKAQHAKFKSVEVIPPVLGQGNFGRIRVVLREPIYKVGLPCGR